MLSLSLHILWLHVHVPLVTNSVDITSLSDLFCRYGTFWRLILYTYFSMFDLFSTSTGSFWPSLYSSYFYGLYCLFSSPWWAHLYIFYRDVHKPLLTYSVHIPCLGDLFCLGGSPSCPILFGLFFFLRLFLYIFYGYVHTYLQWSILHTWPFLVTYSVHKVPFGVLFCTRSSLCLINFV